ASAKTHPDQIGAGRSVLHFAARSGSVEVVKFLVEKGADLESEDADKQTVLHDAARWGGADLVKYLLDEGL
ncbi:MAG: ankyrin repeat domain-containing protein, partial [Deltaproteobacteria bacterium]|nr:ankyrin repeat domain-containing protein [Deltaproteobacteria bacterium]